MDERRAQIERADASLYARNLRLHPHHNRRVRVPVRIELLD